MNDMFKKYSTGRDVIYSILLCLAIALISYTFQTNLLNFEINKITDIMIGLFGSLLGFIITSVTILLMFDYKQNEILLKIRKAGLYNQIFERYISTIIVLFVSLIIFISLNILSLNYFILNYIVSFLIILTSFRIYRSISLLKDILDNL